ncbi:hypothetical protein [Clostridium frigidicarnis]|uniref:hypothetical protein n=1 Tax=Clostridium frigidicarnis TaxID=84698 RepID=UPI000B7FADBE|nr:hypothetical protein [Clostridium frigidicarnis]
MILWLHDTGEAYTSDIYLIKEQALKKSNKYDKIYFKEVVKYYKSLLETYKDSSTYLYYLALAYEKM